MTDNNNQIAASSFVRTSEEKKDDSESVKSASDRRDVPKKLVKVSIRGMFRFAKPFDVFLIICGALGGIAVGASAAAFAIILGDIFDALNSPNGGAASELALLFVYVGVALFVAGTVQIAFFTTAAERMTIELRQAYLKAILSQDIAFFDEHNAGSLSSQVAENTILYREALGEKLGLIMQYMSMFIAGIVVGFTYLWQLCLVVLALTPLLGAAGYMMFKGISAAVHGQMESYAVAGAVAEETVSMIRTVTAFNLQRQKVAQYQNEVRDAAVKTTKQGFYSGLGFGSLMMAYYCSLSIGFYYGSVMVIDSKSAAAHAYPPLSPPPLDAQFCQVGHAVPANCTSADQGLTFFQTPADVCSCPMCRCGCYYVPPGSDPTYTSSCVTGGTVVLTFFAVLLGSMAIGQAAGPIQTFANGRAAASALYQVIDRKSNIDSNSNKGCELIASEVRGDIKFEDVAFSYPTRKEAPVFTNFNLTIPGGKRVALVGESGSGKSTCIALLERYYDPDSGSITLDGRDLREFNVRHLRQTIGLVSQEPILFGTSIMENVRFGRPDASDEDVIRACQDANADQFIQSFPDNYQTFVTSSLVSGGQKQRLAIARALLRNPPILLLDEATAALDNESERLVNQAIDKLLAAGAGGSRTTIVIAHRLSSIRACDRIFVLERGQVVEEGSHDELVERQGLYASLSKLSDGGRSATAEPSNSLDSNHKRDVEDGPIVADRGKGLGEPIAFQESVSKQDKSQDEGSVVKEKRHSVRKAFRYAYPERLWFIPAIFGAIGNGASLPLFALLFANLVDTFFYTNSSMIRSQATIWCLAFFGLALAAAFCILLQNWCFGFISGRMTMRVRSETFQHILSMEMGFFDEKRNSVGALCSKLASDASLLRAAICDRMAALAMNTSTLVSGYTIAMLGSWKLSLVVTSLFPAIVAAGALEYMAMAGMANADQKALEEASHTLSESINGIRTVTAFNMQSSIQQLYFQQLLIPLRKAQRKGWMGGMGYGFSQGVQFFCFALTLWYGSILIANGEINFRQLNQAMFGIFMCAMALGQNAALTPDLAKGQSAVQSIFTLLERQSKIDPFNAEGSKPSALLGDLEFQNIDFAYPTRPDVTVLSGFNLQVQRGQTVAFVGTSGSGKSTLVLLLERFYDPKGGIVKVDGTDVRSLNLEWLRDQIGIVSQEPALFRGSIKDNIRAGKPDATDDEVIEAAKMANAHDFISAFPQGYDTDLQTSTGVSGGQKQRLSIARALIRNPKILLLDEATSALDEESQKVVQEALDRLMQRARRTTIVVAHRLSTIRNADVIVVLQHGVVVEQGSFDELIAKPNGAFGSLLRAQGKMDERH